MAFIFPGDLQVGGDLNIDSGGNIILPSGSDIVLADGANIEGQGDLEGTFSGSLTGSLFGTASFATTASFALNSFDGVSSSHALRADTADLVSFDVITGLPDGLVTTSAQVTAFGFISSSTQFDPADILLFTASADAEITALMAATSSFLTSSVPFDPTDIDTRIDGIEAKTGSFLTSSVPFDPTDIDSRIDGIEAKTGSFLTSSVPFDPTDIDTRIDGIEAKTGSFLTSSVPFDPTDIDTRIDGLEAKSGSYVSSSQQILDFGFIKTTGSDPNLVASASYAFTASVAMNAFDGVSSSHAVRADIADSVPFSVISNLPDDLVSSSQQVLDFGFVKSTGSDPNMVPSASYAEFSETASLAYRADRLSSFANIRTQQGQHALLMTQASSSGDQNNGNIGFAGTNTSLGSLKFNPNRGGNNDAAELTIGAVGVTGILDVDRIDMNADMIISDGVIQLIGTSNGGYISFYDVTLPNALVNQGALGRENGKLKFASGSQFHELFFESSQVDISLTTGSIPGSRVIGDIAASSVEFGNVLNKPTLFSSSAQVSITSVDSASRAISASHADTAGSVDFEFVSGLPDNLVSSSVQITLTDTTGNISGSRVVGDIQASSVEFSNVLNKPTLFSSSAQVGTVAQANTASYVFYDGVDTSGAQWVSSSAQITALGFMSTSDSGTISSSAQITAHGFISESYNTNGTGITSGSAQIVSLLDGQDVTLGVVTATELNTTTVSSSVLFTSGSNIIGDDVTDTHQFTGSVSISGSFDVDGISFISSSGQITAFGFSSASVDSVNSASRAERATVAEKVDVSLVSDNQNYEVAIVNSVGERPINIDSVFTYNPSTNRLTTPNLTVSNTLTADVISQSAQVAIGSTTGNLATSRLTGTISADNVDTTNATSNTSYRLAFTDGTGNDKTVFNSSQLTYNPSLDVLTVGDVEGTISTASFIEYSNINGLPSLFSSSAQVGTVARSTTASYADMAGAVDFEFVSGLPDNLVSSSVQITLADTTGNISGSRIIGDIQASSVEFNNVLNKPTLFSSSAQVSYTSIQNRPTIPAAANDATITVTAGDGISGGGNFTTDQSGNETLTLSLDESFSPEFTSGMSVAGGNLKILNAANLEFSASSGASGIRYRASDGGNKLAMRFDHDNDRVSFQNRASNGYFDFFANNATAGVSGESKVAEFRHDEAQFFQKISGSSIEVSGTITGDISTTTGNISGSRVVGDIQASSVDFDNVLNKPTLFSSSAQVNITSVDSSSRATSASYADIAGSVDFEFVSSLPDNLVSSSAQIDYDSIQNQPTIPSAAANATITLTAGTNLSGGGNFTTNQSSDETITFNANLPSGTVSGSAQIDPSDIDFSALTHYNDDAAAASGGVAIGKLYRNGNFIQVRLT